MSSNSITPVTFTCRPGRATSQARDGAGYVFEGLVVRSVQCGDESVDFRPVIPDYSLSGGSQTLAYSFDDRVARRMMEAVRAYFAVGVPKSTKYDSGYFVGYVYGGIFRTPLDARRYTVHGSPTNAAQVRRGSAYYVHNDRDTNCNFIGLGPRRALTVTGLGSELVICDVSQLMRAYGCDQVWKTVRMY